MKTLHTIYTSFAKRLAVVLTLLLTFGVTSAWGAEEELVYTLDGTTTGGTNAYDSGSEITQSEITWQVTGNTTMSPWRIGGKSIENKDRTVYSTKAIEDDISKIVITHGTASSITVNSMKVIVSTAQNGGGTVISTLTPTFKVNGDVTITRPDGKDWSKAFYKIVYNVTVSSTSNKFIEFTSAKFYKTNTPACEYTVQFNSNGGTGSMSDQIFTCEESQKLTANSFSRTGYTFAGWNTKADGLGTSYTNQQSVTDLTSNGETITLYAKWTPTEYTITYNGLEGATHSNPTNYTIESETITFTAPSERVGYNFIGWNPASITMGSTGNKTITAQWTEKALTNYRTSCTEPCEQLGVATGLSVQTDYVDNGQTYVKFSWTPADNTKSHATKQVICIGKVGEEKKCTDLEGNQVWSGDLRSKLTPGEYEWTIQAIGDGETYCDGEVISGPNFTIEEPLTDNCRWVEIALEDITPEDEIVVTMGNDEIGYALGTEKITNSPKSQAITIASGMIDINQDFDYSKYTWSISTVAGGYQLQPYGTTQYLYGVASYITISSNPTTFSIFTSPETGNKCFAYVIGSNAYFLGYGKESNQDAWKQLTSYASLLKSNTLKFYKKTCLPADEYWINYNLSNVTCTTDPIPSQIANDGEELLLEFSANDGYKLPEQVSITMGGNTLSEEAFDWDAEEGILYIVPEDGITGDIVITVEGCELLAIPTNLKANNITSSSATLSWDEIDHATEYQVHITDDDDSTEDIITTTSNTYYEVTGLSSASEYLWGITPIASGYCGLTQEAEIFTTLDVYTVTFNSNGGTAVESQNIDHGGKAAKPTDPTKTGYKFAGWYTEADTEFNFNTPIESATPLYAKWNANQYTITFRQQWGNEGTETATVHFDNNDFSVSPIIVPTRNGYTFGGYYTAESGAGTQLIDVSGAWLNAPNYIEGGKWVYADNLTLYAKWTQNFTITWMANGQPYHTQTAMIGTAIAKPDDPDANEFACDDKVFVGWLDKTISGSTNEEPTFVTDFGTIQAAKTYHAVFATLTGTPSNDYDKITDINDLTDGEYVIAYSYDGGTQVVLKNTTKDAKYMNASALAPSSNKYTSPSAEYIWQLQKQDDGSYYMYNSSVNKFLYATTSALQLSDNPTKYTISYDNNYSHWKIKLTNNTSYYMHGYVSGSSYDFRVSTSGSGNKYRVYLYKNASTAVYSDYVTTCVEIPTPHWEGAEIDNADIAVDCGTISYKTNASTITFPTDKNYDLTYPITLTASEGFLLSTNKQNDVYEQSVTVTPVQSDENKGKITQSVHVRADATGKNTNFDGTITISGDQLAEDQIIEVHAVVDCPQYTLTFNDCGDTKTITDFAGTSVEEMEPWAETCSEPFQYVFDGWATAPVTNGTEKYDKVDFFTFTMPNNNSTILYAVYRYAEEGGDPVNGYVKVTEALADWSGDYVIVDDENLFAIKNAYRENASQNKTLAGETVTIENDKVVSPSANIVWSFSKNGNGYTMYSDANKMYAGVTDNDTRRAILSSEVTDDCIFKFIYDNTTHIAKVSAITTGRCFQYYVNGDQKEWRTYSSSLSQYNTGYLYRLSNKTIRYTSSLVCGSIEAENAIVTSTVGQTVKVYVPITLGYSDAASITGTSDNEAFTVVTKNDVAVGESNIEVHYKPTAYVNTANQEETATITLTTSNGATTTFNVTGRCLPETFAIVAKVGNVWYALPSQGLNSETTPVGYPVEVDNNDNPTAVTSLPTKAEWALRNVYKVNGSNDRFAANGENLVFVNAENKTLYASKDNANIQTYAEYSNYVATNPDRYEWVPTTTDLTNYTLKNVGRAKELSINVNATFGTHASNIASNNIRFLPIQNRYTPAALQVVEWKENSVVIMYNGDPAQTASVSVNGAAAQNTTLSAAQRDIAVYELAATGLAANPTQRLSITIGSEKVILPIPYIINSETTDATILPDGTVAARQEVAKVSDLVILKDATLTAAGAKGNPYKFRNVTVYGGGKLVVPADNGFGVNSLTLRIGGVTADGNYDYVYPEFVLNTKDAYTNTSGKINLDYVTTKEQYYTFVAPFAVQTKDIHYPVDIYGNNVAANNRGSFEFQYYDGAARAAGERGWKVVEEDPTDGATLTAHKGYTFYGMPKKVSVNGGTSIRQKFGIHRIPMTATAANVMSHENGAQTVAISAHPSEKNINSGWNLIGNPYMSTITGLDNQSIVTGTIVLVDNRWEWSNDETYNQRFIVFPSNDGEWYYASQASNATLPAFKNFFVQIDNEANALSIPYTHRASGSAAPARRVAEDMDKDIELAIVLEQDDKCADQMDFLLNDAYSAVYDRNADFTKMMNNTNFNLFGVHLDDYLSFVAIDTYTARSSVAIGYQVPQAGQYTLRLSDKPYVMWSMVDAIYVTDHEVTPEVTTNLLDEAYTFQVTNAETNTTRFSISIVPSKESGGTTTAIDDILHQDMQTQKIIYNDQLYILRGGVVYDAMGQRVTTINQ